MHPKLNGLVEELLEMEEIMLQAVADEEMHRSKWKYIKQLDQWIERNGLAPHSEFPLCQPAEQKPSCVLKEDTFTKVDDHIDCNSYAVNSACIEFITLVIRLAKSSSPLEIRLLSVIE